MKVISLVWPRRCLQLLSIPLYIMLLSIHRIINLNELSYSIVYLLGQCLMIWENRDCNVPAATTCLIK